MIKAIIIRYVIDTWAWIEYLDGTEKGEKAKEIIENSENQIFTNSMVLIEVVSVAKRKNKDYKIISDTILTLSKIFHDDIEFFIDAGLLHAEIKQKIKDFGLVDALVLATARKLDAKILTGDPHFRSFKEAVMI